MGGGRLRDHPGGGVTGGAVAIGSSSVAPGSPLPSMLGEAVGLEVSAHGIVGARVATWRRELEGSPPAWLAAASAVVVYLGGNDPVERPPSAADVRAVGRMIRSAVPGAPVVWLPPPEYPPTSTDAFGRAMRGRRAGMVRALRAAGATYVRAPVELRASELAADGVHPTRAGYRRWTAAVAAELRRRMRLSSPPPSTSSGAGAAVAVAAAAAVLAASANSA